MKYILGFSGGLDSTCLLHMLSCDANFNNDKLLAVYVNHNVSPNASAWQLHCEQVCKNHQISFYAVTVTVSDSESKGFEAAARKARYAALADLMEHDDVLFTAHHQDDQAETFLLQALRGAGVSGLAGMPLVKPFVQGEHHRPLLDKTRAELVAYANEHDLSWVEDESNQQINYARNYLRHNVMPAFLTYWPSAQQSLAQSSQYAAEAMELVMVLAKQDIQSCVTSRQTINIKQLLLLSRVRQKNTLRYWLQCNASIPSGRVLEQIFSNVICAADDAMPLLSWNDVNVRRYQGELYCETKQLPEKRESFDWDWQQPIEIAGHRYGIQSSTTGLDKENFPEKINIQFRQSGEKVILFGNAQTKHLKKLFQAWQVPPWKRDKLPLFFSGDELIAAPPYYHATVRGKSEKTGKIVIAKMQGGIA